MTEQKSLLEIENLKKYYLIQRSIDPKKRKYLKAVDGISLTVHENETVGLVGESGCGKSTLGRSVLNLHEITDGKIRFQGQEIQSLKKEEMRFLRQKMQMIFQDPYASLNPRMSIAELIGAPLKVYEIGNATEQNQRVHEIMDLVGLGDRFWDSYPHEMSGGQRQRVVIARAMILNPNFVVCDEPVSALDVSVRAQVLNLMLDMKEKTKLSYLFISHDLSVVRYFCDSIAVMYLGKIVEMGAKQEIFDHPLHPYTRALMSAIPIPDVTTKRERILLKGDVPSPVNPPRGCPFHTRCPYSKEKCMEEVPQLKEYSTGHKAACFMEF